MFGKIMLYTALIGLLLSMATYFLSFKKERLTKYARYFFYFSTFTIILASLYFLASILSHNFQITYIWEHSSKHLEPYLLFSSFYAGQEGSFLLWLLFFAIFGLFFQARSKKVGYESLNMGFYAMIMLFIVIILVIKNPFDYIWQTYANDGIAYGHTPLEGRGLNPVLENYWMAIHPPILFIGYTLLAVPFVFALSGIIRKEYDKWLEYSMSWTLIGAGILGLGIMLGGFWAYETLGWGGFWGWDPVENSSLIPWLIILTFIHTAVVQKKTNALKKTNIILALMSFILVLYATFLTRSGILGDASVHSFTDPGKAVYAMLLIIVVINFIIGMFAFFLRAKNIESKSIKGDLISREMILIIGSVIMIALTVIVFFGTNWSLITDMMGKTKSSVGTTFFNTWTLPLAIIIFLTSAVSQYFNWKTTRINSFLKKSAPSIIVALVLTVISAIYGISGIGNLILMFAVLFSLFANLYFIILKAKKHSILRGGMISHIGFAVFMLGVILSNTMETVENIVLTQGNQVKSNEFVFELLDKYEIEKPKTDRQKFLYRVRATNNSDTFLIEPVVYWSSFNNMESPIIEPGIKRTWSQDIYLSLKSSDVKNPLQTLSIEKGQKTLFLLDSTINIEFISYDMGHTHMEHNANKFGAIVKISNAENSVYDTLFLNVTEKSIFDNIKWKKLSLCDYDVSFLRFIPKSENIAQSKIVLAFKKTNEEFVKPMEFILCEVSFKPFMSAVWVGVFLITIGFFITLLNHKHGKKKDLTTS